MRRERRPGQGGAATDGKAERHPQDSPAVRSRQIGGWLDDQQCLADELRRRRQEFPEPRQLEFAEPVPEPPVHSPPRPEPDRDEAPFYDDIAEAWEDLTGQPHPGRRRVLELLECARKAGRLREP